MKWHPTPDDEVITARRLAGDQWEPCRFEDIRKGDIFRAVFEDQLIHPVWLEPNPDVVALAIGDAIKNDPLGSNGQHYGYAVPINVYDSIDELNRRGLS